METKYWVNNYSALCSTGVQFIGKEGNPLDIEFNWLGQLRIPTLYLDNKTIGILMKLVAYEQGSRQLKPYFTSLAIFFSNIATSPEDVRILRGAGIIHYQAADDQTVLLFLQKLYKATAYSSNDCLIKYQVRRLNLFATSLLNRFTVYISRQFVGCLIQILVLFLTVWVSYVVN